MWYNGYMTTDNWINLIAAILVGGGTFFLGIMAWRTIRQTRNIQKAEQRERLLNEIIEWAVDFKACLYNPDVLGKDQKTLYAITHLRIVGVNARRKKIETIAQKEFGDYLFKYVDKVENSVVQYLAAVEYAVGIDEDQILLDEERKSEIRNKIGQVRARGRKEIDSVVGEYVEPLVTSTTNLIEKCSALIIEL